MSFAVNGGLSCRFAEARLPYNRSDPDRSVGALQPGSDRQSFYLNERG